MRSGISSKLISSRRWWGRTVLIVSSASLPACTPCNTSPTANRRSASSVVTSTATSPLIPCDFTTRPMSNCMRARLPASKSKSAQRNRWALGSENASCRQTSRQRSLRQPQCRLQPHRWILQHRLQQPCSPPHPLRPWRRLQLLRQPSPQRPPWPSGASR